jgi:hypothetical protein
MLRVARRKVPKLPVDGLSFVNRLPLRWPRGSTSSDNVTFEPGVSKILGLFLDPPQHGELYSRYDLEYVQWQVGDCPFLFSETCTVTDASTPRAAALIWREKASPDFWRFAVWSREGAGKELETLVSSVIRRVYDYKGFLLSFVVSRLDQSLIGLLRRRKFLTAPRRRPLHIIASTNTGEGVPELWPLSYLDTDYAYRF